MARTYTSSLGLTKPATGEEDGVWGDLVNAEITELVDTAIAGVTTITADSDVELTRLQGEADTSRAPIVVLSGSRTADRQITLPYRGGQYTVVNQTSRDMQIFIRLSGGGLDASVGVVPPNRIVLLFADGTTYRRLLNPNEEFLEASNNLSELSSTTTARSNLGLGSAAVAALVGSVAGGAAMEVVANANGRAYRFAGGLQVCLKDIAFNMTANPINDNFVTGWFRSGSITGGALPQPHVGSPVFEAVMAGFTSDAPGGTVPFIEVHIGQGTRNKLTTFPQFTLVLPLSWTAASGAPQSGVATAISIGRWQ